MMRQTNTVLRNRCDCRAEGTNIEGVNGRFAPTQIEWKEQLKIIFYALVELTFVVMVILVRYAFDAIACHFAA